jgi:hypothetical protein
MYYSNGNYEAFARPRKPKGVENKTACFVGSGLAALAGAAFLIRDGQMPGNRITILEQQQLPGGALDGIKEPQRGFVIRGGREMEEHFECLWDLYRSIPSLEIDQPDCRRAAHASSVGPIDPAQLFYLESRGITPDEARKFITLGFLEPVVARVPLESERERLWGLLEVKWAQRRDQDASAAGAPAA